MTSKSKEWDNLKPEHQEILGRHLSERPVKVGKIAKDLNVSVKISHLPPEISGQIKYEENEYVVRVNRFEARERQRFTIAHELAHFLLHKELIDKSPDGIKDNVLYRSEKLEDIEYEADSLAAEIIMPSILIQEALHKHFNGIITEETIEGLAELFQVSKTAMEIRLKRLSRKKLIVLTAPVNPEAVAAYG